MRIEFNIGDLEKNLKKIQKQEFIKKAMYRAGMETEDIAKEIINTFTNKEGHSQGVDSGAFRDGVYSSEIKDGFGFKVRDSTPTGIYHEFGTVQHFVPFFDRGGSITSLGQWAMRHFDDLDFEAIGKSGKVLKKPSRASREDVLKAKGGIMVSLDEMAPFRKALAETSRNIKKIFKEEFKWQMKK